MKKTIIIVAGAIFLLLLVGVWAYLFFVGTPESVDDVFSDFNFGGEPAPITTTEDDADPVDDNIDNDDTAPRNALSQLTTTPVAGFTFLDTNASSSATELMYVESGTGHVYHYHLDDQQRTRVSNKTIPATRNAYIDTDGQYTVIETPEQLQILPIGEGTSTDATTLEGDYQNLYLSADDTLYYTQTDTTGTTAYRYDVATGNTTTLFSAPMQAVRVLWNDNGSHHLYNTTAETLRGHLYRVDGNTLRRTPIAGRSLEVIYGPETGSFIYTTQANQDMPVSTYWSPEGEQRLSGFARPEKCTVANEQTWCAFAVTDTTNVTAWYRGNHSFADNLWEIDHISGSSRLLVNFTNVGGREIDVDDIKINHTASDFLLRNKRDGYLWTYSIN